MASNYDLFCYGTLCFPEVMHSVIGRVPASVEASLADFACYRLHGASYPAIIPEQHGVVNGLLYTGLAMKELRCIDIYEGRQYLRAQVNITYAEGAVKTAWGYLLAPGQYYRLKKQPWCRDKFAKDELDKYIIRHGWRSRGRR
jgi:gamma-glutamylcyclotransferase (GGCT)/AIG2-like uncharacterized protein YtfP